MATLIARAEWLPVKNYTTADGLARDQINRIVRDSNGYLWFCTEEGLSRFDGYEFTNYTTDHGLPSRTVYDLLETRGGIYWVATANGLCKFNPRGRSGSTKSHSPSANNAAAPEPMFTTYLAEAESGRQITGLLEDQAGTIWCGTGVGLYRLEQTGSHPTIHAVDIGMTNESMDDKFVQAIIEDRLGSLWVATRGSGLYRRWPDGHSEHYTVRNGLLDNGVKSLLEDRDGTLWVGTVKGLCQLVRDPVPNHSIVARKYTSKDGLAEGWIVTIYRASDGRFWVGATSGLSEFVSSAGGNAAFRTYTTQQGLSDNHVSTLGEDREGNLWIGTGSGGAIKLVRNGFITYATADGLDQAGVNSIFEDQLGELCVTASSRDRFVAQFDGKRFITIRPAIPPSIKNLGWGWNQIALQDHEGEWWLATGDGVCRFARTANVAELALRSPKAIYTTRDGLPDNNSFRVFEDSHGDIWISTASPVRAGISRLDRKTGKIHSYTESDGYEKSKMGAPMAFFDDTAGHVWIGVWTGLARHANGRLEMFTDADELSFGGVRAFYADRRGRLWIASSRGGLVCIEDPSAEHPHFLSYRTSDGLSSNEVWSVAEDDFGHIFAGTGKGVDRLDPATRLIKHYTTADGLVRGDITSAFQDHHGALWFCSRFGVSRLIPVPDQPQSPPPVVIKGLTIAGSVFPISELG
ncbi:MAG TPA: two-component regulator propeller domain-containing protein, partial [Blastocatellia bacterium]|nr:two-component regulator propeller domain-containing protein [Blastocatellia bacterium]